MLDDSPMTTSSPAMKDAHRREWTAVVDPETRARVKAAAEDNHTLRRNVTVWQNQVLTLHRGTLSVAVNEREKVKSHGNYHCSCGQRFAGTAEAEEHLRNVAEDGE